MSVSLMKPILICSFSSLSGFACICADSTAAPSASPVTIQRRDQFEVPFIPAPAKHQAKKNAAGRWSHQPLSGEDQDTAALPSGPRVGPWLSLKQSLCHRRILREARNRRSGSESGGLETPAASPQCTEA